METTAQNGLIKVEETKKILSTAVNVLETNKTSLTNCTNAGKSIYDTIQSLGGITSKELDDIAAAFIEKTKKTITNMNDRRKPITQILTALAKEFTSCESAIDPKTAGSYAFLLQQYRNKYAEEQLRLQRIEQEKKERELKKQTETSEFKRICKNYIIKWYSEWSTTKVNEVTRIYSLMTIDNRKETERQLRNFPICGPTTIETTFSASNVYDPMVIIHLLTAEEKTNILHSARTETMPQCEKEAIEKISSEVTNCLDKIPSRFQELEEIDKLEKHNAAEAQKLKDQAAAREQAELLKKQKKEAVAVSQAETATKIESSSSAMESLFESAANVSVPTPVAAKIEQKIKIVHAAGILEVFQMWWLNEGQTLPIDELEKMMKKQITFCEKKANKENIKITSKFVTYVDSVTAK